MKTTYKRTKWIAVILTSAILVIVFVCLTFPSSVPEPDGQTVKSLETAAETWWKFKSEIHEIPKSQWPPELAQLRPKSVRVTLEGVYISFESMFVKERGLFILPTGSNFQPQQATDPSFNLIQGRVYRFLISG